MHMNFSYIPLDTGYGERPIMYAAGPISTLIASRPKSSPRRIDRPWTALADWFTQHLLQLLFSQESIGSKSIRADNEA